MQKLVGPTSSHRLFVPAGLPGCWQRRLESNQYLRFWRPPCYHYTTPLGTGGWSRTSTYGSQSPGPYLLATPAYWSSSRLDCHTLMPARGPESISSAAVRSWQGGRILTRSFQRALSFPCEPRRTVSHCPGATRPLAQAAGVEPAYLGVKVPCLTIWLRLYKNRHPRDIP